jgi:hypothetical protein
VFLRARNHPHVADSIIRLLRRVGPQPTARLRKGIAVRALAMDPTKPAERQAGGQSFADTTGALAEASVLRVGDEVVLTDAFATHLQDRDPARGLVTWLLDESRTGSDPCGEDSGPTGDLAHAATWFLHIDPSGPWPTIGRDARDRSPIERLRQDTGRTLPSTTFNDGTDWTRFQRWMSFLGLAELRPGNALDPDPTRCVRWVIEDTLPEGRATIEAFLTALASSLPIFGGHLERSWHGTNPGYDGGSDVRPALAHAIVRLERSGLFQMDAGADASETAVLSFGSYQPRRSPVGEVRPASQRVAAVILGGDA